MTNQTTGSLIDYYSQLNVLSSILAGFSFAVIAQLALRDRKGKAPEPNLRKDTAMWTFLAFAICTVAFVSSVFSTNILSMYYISGIYLEQNETIARLSWLIGIFAFSFGIIGLGWIYSRRFGIIATIAGATLLVVVGIVFSNIGSQIP